MSNPSKVVSDYYVKDRENDRRSRLGIAQAGVRYGSRQVMGKTDPAADLVDIGSVILFLFGGRTGKVIPHVDKGLYKQLETAIEMGDLTIPELMVTRKIFRSHPVIRATINAIVRKYRGKA